MRFKELAPNLAPVASGKWASGQIYTQSSCKLANLLRVAIGLNSLKSILSLNKLFIVNSFTIPKSATGPMRGYDCPLSFSVACASARSPIPDLRPLLFVSLLQARLRLGHLARTPGLFGLPAPPHLPASLPQETTAPPKPGLSVVEGFPGDPFDLMPGSQTPGVTLTIVNFPTASLIPTDTCQQLTLINPPSSDEAKGRGHSYIDWTLSQTLEPTVL